MFNEHEIASFLEDKEIAEAVFAKKKDFVTSEAKFLEISDHDFLSLIMMAPSVGIAKSNGSVSLFEELALNKIARKMSKGGYFLQKDPVSHAMKFLIKNYEKWEDPFFNVIKLCMSKNFELQQIQSNSPDKYSEDPLIDFNYHLIKTPYGFVRFLCAFFVHDDNKLISKREVTKVEYEKIMEMAKKLELADTPIFSAFIKLFKVK